MTLGKCGERCSDDPFEVLDLQDEMQTRCTGGTAVDLFVGEEPADPAVRPVVYSCGTRAGGPPGRNFLLAILTIHMYSS